MSELEEEIIRLKNAYKKETGGTLEEGFYIRGQQIRFQPTEVLEGKLLVTLPETFTDLPLEYAKIKYPSEQRPAVIKSNEEGSVNFTFHLLPVSVPKGKVFQLRDQMKKAMKQFQPANVFFEANQLQTETLELAWFDYKSHGIDEKIYNRMYFIPMGEQVLHGVFNCPMAEGDLWKPIVMEVMKSIVFMEKEETEEASNKREF